MQTVVTFSSDWHTSPMLIKDSKSTHADFALRPSRYNPIQVDNKVVLGADHAMYLRYVSVPTPKLQSTCQKKRDGINTCKCKMYWLLDRSSTFSLTNKRLLYLVILKPMRIYDLKLWECTTPSKRNAFKIKSWASSLGSCGLSVESNFR